ncbi:MAG: ABC transporter ATP-binding protein [Candidatus Brocadiia bacterium]
MITGDFAVVAEELEKRFGDFIAVNKISFSVEKGRIFGFLGPNGAGKSTTIKMLCGILTPTSGAGQVGGFDIRRESERIKENIGYMSQKFSLYDDLTVEENINFFSGIYRVPRSKKVSRKEWVLEMAGLKDFRHSRTAALASGWKQRLALGCAVLHEPPILFLDEPTSGVDPLSRRAFWDLIYEMTDKAVTVFVTTHYMEEAEYCDQLGMIYRGELIARGTPREMKTTYFTEQVIEVSCDCPAEAITTALEVPGVKNATLSGRGMHCVVEDDKAVGSALILALQAKGYTAREAIRVNPSLEDVFVSLIEKHDSNREELKEFSA